ncbi:hypothetical protein [Streptomyces sp. NPDC048720]|uniref:hypothetical protein n=1 Tax=Streptomyces sp. NPDC048720 TaxID=3365588 RepID=UPI0037197EB9
MNRPAQMLIDDANDIYVELGEVILFNNAMVILRDYSMFSAKVETEDGETQWVSRSQLRPIA